MSPAGGALLSIAFASCATDDPAELGSRRGHIVGGATTSSFPSVPLLVVEDPQQNYLCSGSLVSPRVVLTAAHCIPDAPPATHVAYFGSDATRENDPAFVATIAVERFVRHPGYDPALDPESGLDFGLILLTEPAPLDPLPFLTAELAAGVGDAVEAVGWGITSFAQNDSAVKRQVATVFDGNNDLLIRFGEAGARGVCSGDSGGPLFMTEAGQPTVIGVHSFVTTIGGDCYESFAGRVDVVAEDFIAPFIAANDPPVSCVADGACVTGCDDDPDCASGDGGSGGGGGGVAEAPVPSSAVGGCAAGGSGRATGLAFVLLVVIGHAWARRRLG